MPPPVKPPVPVSVSTTAPGGTLAVVTNVSGDLTITLGGVTGPAAHNGVYARDVDGNALNPDALGWGPQCLVAVAIGGDGSPAPGKTLTSTPGLWIHDSAHPAPALSHQWYRNGVAIAGATGPSHVLQAADQGATLTLTETATDAGGARSCTSGGLAVPAAPAAASSLSVTRLGGFQSNGIASVTPSFNINTSDLVAGDDVYFAYGVQRYATAATVNGAPATKVSTDAGNIGAGRLAVFRYRLQGGDIRAAIPVDIVIDSVQTHHVFDCWRVAGGTLTDSTAAQRGGTADPVTVTPTVSGTDNCVLIWGAGTTWNSMTYSGAAEVQTASLPTATSRSMTVGLAEDVPAGLRTITVTPGVSGHLGVVAITLRG